MLFWLGSTARRARKGALLGGFRSATVWEAIRAKIRRCDELFLFVWRRRDSSSGGAFVLVERRVSSRGGKFFFKWRGVSSREASFFVWRGVSPPLGFGPRELRSKGKDGVNKNNFLCQIRESQVTCPPLRMAERLQKIPSLFHWNSFTEDRQICHPRKLFAVLALSRGPFR